MVLNITIAHIRGAESIIERNENLLQVRIMKYLTHEKLNEQSIIHIAIMSDLICDAENIIEYLTYRQGAMHPKLMSIDDIIRQLKEVTQQIPQGLYFPFKVHNEDWLVIEKHTNNRVQQQNDCLYRITFPTNCIAELRFN